MRSPTLAIFVGLAIPVVAVGCDDTTARTPAAAQEADQIVTTQHQITLDGQTLSYTARAGLIPIRDNEAGDIHAHMFFMAYTLDRATDQPRRPLTFLWNGGPGMNSSLIHLLGFGPKRIKTGDVYPTSPPLSETEMEDNQETWLDQTDLVFVDPVGTGYSRPTKPEYGSEFYQTAGDIEAIAEFIRVYRGRFDAWDAPLFIVGHSYGTTRAMGVADVLERRGIELSGVVLLSGGMGASAPVGSAFRVGQDPLPPELETALNVPGMTAAAFYHEKLAPELQRDLETTLKEAEAWAQNEYATALSKRDAMSDGDLEAVLRGLSRFTGLDVSVLDRSTLSVDRNQFRTGLLQNMVLGNYDLRMTRASRPEEVGYDIYTDPSFEPALKLVQGTSTLLNRYLRSDLQFKSDLLYQGPLGGGYPPAESINRRFVGDKVEPDASPDGSRPQPPLRRALDANQAIRVFVVRGLYDSGSCFKHIYGINHLKPSLAGRVSVACYGAGHDFYTDKAVRQQIKRDMMAFIQRTLAGATARTSPE